MTLNGTKRPVLDKQKQPTGAVQPETSFLNRLPGLLDSLHSLSDAKQLTFRPAAFCCPANTEHPNPSKSNTKCGEYPWSN